MTTPDDALLKAAANKELSGSGYGIEVDRILSDSRTGQSLGRFVREWLALDQMRPLNTNVNDPAFKTFAGSDLPNGTLKEEMIQDVMDSIAYHTQVEQGGILDWFESPYSFAKSAALAKIYGVPVWDGVSDPPLSNRPGLLVRPAMVATGTVNTRPIMKGVTIRERLLCDHMLPPPNNVQNTLPDLSGEKTTRELVAAITEVPKTVCANCHVPLINPLGFATEGYDALGRARAKQDLYNAQGAVVASKPVDTASVPRVWPDDTTPSTGAESLVNLISTSEKLEACFARQYTRYTKGRKEDEKVDGCELEAVRSNLIENDSIIEVLKKIAMLPSFRQRIVVQ